jgi:hypothetical protein
MTTFVRLLRDSDKAQELKLTCTQVRTGQEDSRVFDVSPSAFNSLPGKPFVYWATEAIINIFGKFPSFEEGGRKVKQGLATADDFRFVRLWWESKADEVWFPFAKGGAFSPFYSDIYLLVKWWKNGFEIWNNLNASGGVRSNIWMLKDTSRAYFFRPSITWPRRAHLKGSFRLIPKDSIFSDSGPCAFDEDPLVLLGILNSSAYLYLLMLLMPRGTEGGQTLKLEVGYVASVPIPKPNTDQKQKISAFAARSWLLRRNLDTIEETSHAFLLPTALRARSKDYDPPAIEAELTYIQEEIDEIVFDLYGFSEADRAAALGSSGAADKDDIDGAEGADDSEDEDDAEAVDQMDGLLSWAAGVTIGRFDWRLATGERASPPEPDPFDPLPAKSPGMLPDDAEPFYAHSGILVDDQGHPNDLARLIEEVLARVEASVPADVRRWLQRDFFPLHLKQYSKSRRKGPIYWPISTSSGSYTLWLYYPSLTDQTLFTAVNDFIEPKLKQVGQDVTVLRTKGNARSRDDEKNFEALQALELEIIELRDTLLAVAPTYRPNHDDGVQITAAPLWKLFRHKPWQKILKDTWAKLEKGDYDWAHLAMAYWSDRVREKCKTDKSLAIAHDLEDLYVEPEPKPTKSRGLKKGGKE